MAKTGSTAVAAALRAASVGPVHHVHDLDPAFLAREELEYRWAGRPWRIWDAQRLLKHPPGPDAPWRVVSIVRDPIAQTMSAFFQPGVRRGYVHPAATVDSLLDAFGDRLDHLPLRWFESHVAPALGIDVYATPFDPRRRHQVISTPAVQLLLLRCEDLEAAPGALAALVGTTRPIDVPRVNVGAEKDYSELYEGFRAAVRPTSTQLDRAYGSRLVTHFYSADEIARLRAAWSEGPAQEAGTAPVRDDEAR
jgi:Putative capsular polysaccharide synthesis protein